MKKILVILMLINMIIPFSVGAKDHYITQNGIEMDKEIYDKLCIIYSKGYVETLTQKEYKNLMKYNLEDIQKETYEEKINQENMPYDSYYSTSSKTISLIKNGNNVTLLAKWISIPKVKSYDVIATRFNGLSLNGYYSFKQVYLSNGSYNSTNNGNCQTFSNGLGCSALLQNGTEQEYSLTFEVVGNGTIYGSYQHATTTVSLAESKNYTISSSGLGSVINFSSSVASKYDGMKGVDVSF